jgi:hypothetical protein
MILIYVNSNILIKFYNIKFIILLFLLIVNNNKSLKKQFILNFKIIGNLQPG